VQGDARFARRLQPPSRSSSVPFFSAKHTPAFPRRCFRHTLSRQIIPLTHDRRCYHLLGAWCRRPLLRAMFKYQPLDASPNEVRLITVLPRQRIQRWSQRHGKPESRSPRNVNSRKYNQNMDRCSLHQSNDLHGRAHEVKRMADIYRGASKVIAWLGLKT
jgi:hypothetical protein